MPREYMCRKCGEAHEPPTGKKCRRESEPEEEIDEAKRRKKWRRVKRSRTAQ